MPRTAQSHQSAMKKRRCDGLKEFHPNAGRLPELATHAPA